MKREENNPVSSQASTSQEENLLQENSDLHRGSDPQSTGSEISESSHLTTMSSTEEIEVPLESLGDPEEQNDTLGMMPWEEERESCLQHIARLSKEMNKLKLEIKCVSERKTPLPQSFPVVWKKCRKALKDNLQIEDKCEELNVLMKINVELKVALEKQAQRLEEIQNNHKRLQAQRSEILLAHAEGTVTPKPSLWRRFILSFKCEWITRHPPQKTQDSFVQTIEGDALQLLSCDKCTYCKSLWTKASAKSPKCKFPQRCLGSWGAF